MHADDDANDAGTSTSDDDEFVSADATVFHAMSAIDYGSCKYSRRQKERYDDIHDRLIKEAATKIRAFNSTSRIEFSEDECVSIYFGIIAHCLKAKLDPTMESDRTEAVEGIYSNFNLNDSSFRCKCCKNWTKMFASQITVDAETVNSFKATINDICLSDNYVSLMGSNGAAHTLTHWDGSQVQGLGVQDKKRGISR